jgi:hypothetical protein
MPKSILIRLSEIQRDYGLTRYALEQAVADGTLVPYAGPLAKRWKSFYRSDIERLAAKIQAKPTTPWDDVKSVDDLCGGSNVLALFEKCVVREREGKSIRCRLGLWAVTSNDRARSEREAKQYWQQYYADGEYKNLLADAKS